jgi:hypothetical protein
MFLTAKHLFLMQSFIAPYSSGKIECANSFAAITNATAFRPHIQVSEEPRDTRDSLVLKNPL